MKETIAKISKTKSWFFEKIKLLHNKKQYAKLQNKLQAGKKMCHKYSIQRVYIQNIYKSPSDQYEKG